MKKMFAAIRPYAALFRTRFFREIQYRAAAFAGIATQFFWGGMEILLFRAFYETEGETPMTFSQVVSYIWLQQAFLALFMLWFWDADIIECITKGNIAYELARPLGLYRMWFTRVIAQRCARALLRCVPILLIALLLPEPYRLTLPPNLPAFLGFLFTMVTGLLVVAAITMLVYVLTFFTMSPSGVRIFAASIAELLSGAVVPLPFFPGKLRLAAELSPFAAVQNLPLRIYSGNLAGKEALLLAVVQLFWLAVLLGISSGLLSVARRRVVVQGG